MFSGLFGIVVTAAIFALVFVIRKAQAGAAGSSGAPGGYGPTEADRLASPDSPRLRADLAKGQLAELSHWIQSLPPGTWGHEQMFAFARQAAAGARRGSTLPSLVIMAHLERWLYFKLFDRDAAGAERYLQDPQVVAEVNAAFEYSLGAPELPFRMSTRRPHNDAAVFFWLVKDKPRLQRQCQVLGNCYTDMYWQALGEPSAVYSKAYQWAMR